jgi:predicted CXXCH cytochrome family protein
MKFDRLFLWIFPIVAGGLLLTSGCSSTTQRKWLTFFFDGVPPATSMTNHPVAQVSTGTNHTVVATVPRPQWPKPPENVMHRPYAEGKCGQCHGEDMMSAEPKLPIRQLCFTCHKDFLTDFKVKHQPVDNGECLSCHEVHESPNKNLLVKKGNDLCLMCHDDPLAEGKVKHQAVESGECLDCHAPHATNFKGLLKKSVKDTCADCHDDLAKKKDVHQPVEDGDCLACHVPHASNNKHLVKKTAPELCWDCHDNFLEKAKFQHDVVEDCTSCHNPHQSAENSLLVKNVPQLCGDCHDDKDLKAVKGHAGAEGKICTVCHDPHVGTDKNLLKPAAKSPIAANENPP